jgi:hypothetical protein
MHSAKDFLISSERAGRQTHRSRLLLAFVFAFLPFALAPSSPSSPIDSSPPVRRGTKQISRQWNNPNLISGSAALRASATRAGFELETRLPPLACAELHHVRGAPIESIRSIFAIGWRNPSPVWIRAARNCFVVADSPLIRAVCRREHHLCADFPPRSESILWLRSRINLFPFPRISLRVCACGGPGRIWPHLLCRRIPICLSISRNSTRAKSSSSCSARSVFVLVVVLVSVAICIIRCTARVAPGSAPIDSSRAPIGHKKFA